ncbi:MAG TPA: hypothetical protein EYO33_03405 [Phycisphaerales bacterium]|nr:hypothetical protein [Phycisphaerales bacterium]
MLPADMLPVALLGGVISQGNPGALAAFSALVHESSEKPRVLFIILATEFFGTPLYIIWNDIFMRDAQALVKAFEGLSCQRLQEIRVMLESPPLGIEEAKLALGVSEVRL